MRDDVITKEFARLSQQIDELRKDNQRLEQLLTEAQSYLRGSVHLKNGLFLDVASPRTNFLLGWVWAGGDAKEAAALFYPTEK